MEDQLDLFPKEPGEVNAEPKRVPQLKFQPVTSSTLRAVGYCLESRLLGVRFQGGSFYLYSGVESSVWGYLLEARSKGAFLAQEIIPKYSCTKIIEGD